MPLDELTKQLEDNLITKKSEMAEAMDNLDNDTIDAETQMSKIDFNARLSDAEINSILVVDELKRLGIFPPEIGITRQKKRLSVSLKGLGRQEKVELFKGEREQKSGEGLFKRMFSRQ